MPDIRSLAGTVDYEGMPSVRPLAVFDDTSLAFLDALSKQLMSLPEVRAYPDIATFAFFCRRAYMNTARDSYGDTLARSVGRGVSFHVAPSNVPINFAYSFVAGLVAGNACIVRTSSSAFAQTDLVCAAISRVLEQAEFANLKRYVAIVSYGHVHDINVFFSSLCDVRVIWGGDATIAEVRRASLPPRAFDITFADRYSLCIIDAAAYIEIEDRARVAQDFYNDTYLFDQNACSSPRLIYWVGTPAAVDRARATFWDEEHRLLVGRGYEMEPLTVIDKYTAACRAALDLDGVVVAQGSDNLISRIELKTLPSDLPERTTAGGNFFEYSDVSPSKLVDIIARKFQTLTYIGFDSAALSELLLAGGASGIDRIVPCGRASEFSLVWDGHDLPRQMSRVVMRT